jgi:hypothetical protein
MEQAFGQSFAHVRTHTDGNAGRISARQNARAFTVGRDVAFGAGEYRPGTPVGDALIAHELAHVVQQGGASPETQAKAASGPGYGALERDADDAAVGAVASLWGGVKGGLAGLGGRTGAALKSGLRLQRCKDDKKAEEKPAKGVGGAGAAKNKCVVKKGPTYTPNGTIKATASGGKKSASFDLSAEFENDPAKGIAASACEVRQYIQWTKEDPPPNHAGFKPAADYSPDTWYEDRDSASKRFGRRTGPYSECITDNHYEDAAATFDCASGTIYKGHDPPMDGSGARTGEWKFELKVVDVNDGEKQVGTSDFVTVDW